MYNSLVRELVQVGRRTSCLGLINGKMGIAIALFRYAHLSGELTCEDVGCELLDEIYEHLDSSIPISFDSGLWGIGWGIEYLIQNGYMEGDADEVLKDIDQCAVRCIHAYGMSGLSLNNGIVGLGRYILIRIIPTFLKGDTVSSAFLKEYLIYLIDWLEERLEYTNESIDDLLDFLFDLYPTGFYRTKVSVLIEKCMNRYNL
ncbi:hypothetical protein K0G31_22315 [Bacteroides fragilis]|nr:hypothetical protein [Bacteroides fragilis]